MSLFPASSPVRQPLAHFYLKDGYELLVVDTTVDGQTNRGAEIFNRGEDPHVLGGIRSPIRHQLASIHQASAQRTHAITQEVNAFDLSTIKGDLSSKANYLRHMSEAINFSVKIADIEHHASLRLVTERIIAPDGKALSFTPRPMPRGFTDPQAIPVAETAQARRFDRA
jgi:hypothetical protein